ncbi:neural cell adhesion molecule 2-like isoform X3 [Lineus longissimus]|uniref:neural cell adhesion molecule 2-like isoform X3 n=1 Tax=Lineus longissimus TaxID=88925 RepID=UPI00315D8FF7
MWIFPEFLSNVEGILGKTIMQRMQILVAVFGVALMFLSAKAMDLDIKPAGATLAKSKGASFMLTCVATGIPSDSNFKPQLEWYGPNNAGRPLTDADLAAYNGLLDRDTYENKLKIRFEGIKGDAQGKYVCRAKTETGESRQAAIQLQLFKKITFDDAPEEQFPVQGENALIKCVVSGSPEPSITWKVNGKRIDFNSPTNTKYGEDEQKRGIIVKTIAQEDEGAYECHAEVESDGQMQVRKIKVTVNIKPKFADGYKPEVIDTPIVGKTIKLRCFAETGKPEPTYHFYKKSAPNDELTTKKDSRYTLAQKAGPNSKSGELTITDVKAEDDGDYICRTKSQAGPTDVEFNVDVIEPPQLIKFEDQVFKSKEQGFLRCEVNGDPKPELSFKKAGSSSSYVLGKQPDDSRISIKHSTTESGYAVIELQIAGLTAEDTNNYTCSAKNSGGSQEWEGSITVQYKPDLSQTENTSFHWIGNTKNVTCLSDGEPAPSFQWQHDGSDINDDSTYKIFNEKKKSNLQIKIPKGETSANIAWIFGKYTCIATNDIGDDTHDIMVKEAVTPKKPDRVTIIRHTPTTITFKAEGPNEPGQIDLIGYFVELKKDDGTAGDYTAKYDYAINKTIKVFNLESNTKYQFRITSYNAVGSSAEGIKINHTTDNMRAPYPVVIISRNISEQPNVYKIKWEKPDNGGQPIQLYKISYRVVEVDPNDESKIISGEGWMEIKAKINPNKKSYNLRHLRANNYYEVKITAKNDLGVSEPKAYLFKTVQGDAEESTGRGGALSTGAIVGIVIAVFFIFLIIIDVSCYFLHECGILHHICVQFCGKGHTSKSREGDVEEGNKELVKNTDANGDQANCEEVHEMTEDVNDDDREKVDLEDHQDELEPDEKSPLTGNDKPEEIPLEETIKYEEKSPSEKPSPQASPKETSPIIA